MDVIAKSVGISNVWILSNLAAYMQGCGTETFLLESPGPQM